MRSLLVVFLSVVWLGAFYDASTQVRMEPIVSNYQEVLRTIEYPSHCRDNGMEGTVEVLIHLDRQGKIKEYEILGSPCNDLTKAVEAKISSFRFEAPVIHGVPVSSQIMIPIEFRLTI